MKIRDGIGESEEGWFAERVSKRVGDETSTFFWYDRWLRDVPLRLRFSCLFNLSNNKLCTVTDMSNLGWEEGGQAWSVGRRLWVWEEELVVECRHLLYGIVLQPNVSDRWQWNPDIHEGYTVSGAYHILTSPVDPPNVGLHDLVWHKQVLLKVSIFAWRMLRDRLTTKTNLVRRSFLTAADARCAVGCGHDESVSHLFLHCDSYGPLWWHIRAWIGVTGVDPHDISEHLFQFIHYTWNSTKRRSFLHLVWLLCVWMIWNAHNNSLFNNNHTTIEQLLENVKFHSLWWLKANNTKFVLGTQLWWSNPLLCLGID